MNPDEPEVIVTELPDLTDGQVMERINKADMLPINDSNHQHEYEPDPEDETNTYVAMICVKQNCGIGYLQSK